MSHRAEMAALTSRQHGVLSARQLAAIGITRQQQRTAARHGVLEHVAPGVYGVVGTPRSVERRLMIGLLALGDGAVVSHEAAARLHGFDRARPDAVEFTVERRHRNRGHGLTVHSTDRLPAVDRVRVRGFPCTSATRTVIDLARLGVTTVRLEAAIDSAIRSGASSPQVLARRLADLRGPGRNGARRIDALLPDSGGHTWLERRFLALMRAAGLPRPTTQVAHRVGARTVARVDFLFEAAGVVVEVSGRRGHASDAERARDAQRRNELQALGRRVYEFTTRQVADDPDAVVGTVRRALMSRIWLDVRPNR